MISCKNREALLKISGSQSINALRDNIIKGLIYKLNQQLPIHEKSNNDLNAAIISSIKDHVEGITTICV